MAAEFDSDLIIPFTSSDEEEENETEEEEDEKEDRMQEVVMGCSTTCHLAV